ncbi:50S ribosomal protein L30 [Blastomonas aquatica]|uniref:Large ribosomal subunit protein uL30 n=1 Tax=Blastomonas aquatica TaxID=1510276 RepID=A0ABQ1JS05_9SPHN|nr:50S ribosomal protein L30 [Blastomonas aquatica]GGB73522.1 50S ribosomal protein L30 [Blastomonas aquatica]
MATIKLKQTGSPIRRPESQRKILIGLGLNKMNREVEHTDTPEIRGMLQKVRHMVTVID